VFFLCKVWRTSASDAARANSLGALFVKSFQQVLLAWLMKSFRACKTLVISVCRGRLSPVCYPSQNVSMASCSACTLTNPSAAAAALRPFVLPIGAALPVAPPYIVHHRIFSRTASNWHGFPADLRLAGALPTVSDAHTAAVGPMLPLRRCMAWKGSELAGRLSDETRSALEHRMNAKGAIVPSKECRRQGGDIAGIGVCLFCPHPRRPWHRLNEPSLINAMTQPKSRSAIDTTKGNTQLPVGSTINPKASGDTIAATADPVFISPSPSQHIAVRCPSGSTRSGQLRARGRRTRLPKRGRPVSN